jgi:hypothetical protein
MQLRYEEILNNINADIMNLMTRCLDAGTVQVIYSVEIFSFLSNFRYTPTITGNVKVPCPAKENVRNYLNIINPSRPEEKSETIAV